MHQGVAPTTTPPPTAVGEAKPIEDVLNQRGQRRPADDALSSGFSSLE
jgi:hypothetical protein